MYMRDIALLKGVIESMCDAELSQKKGANIRTFNISTLLGEKVRYDYAFFLNSFMNSANASHALFGRAL